MNLEKLAIIFIIIILPISIILKAYTDYEIKTLNLQTSYDSKLNKATADAVKAYQLNAFNEGASGLTESKMRNINAAANTFFNSLLANYNLEGYNREYIEQYVPALAFTMYDGYYIYSKYTNTLTDKDYSKAKQNNGYQASTYQNGDTLYGIKPFIPYSCRYKVGNIDVVISYTLDNYISVQGRIGNESVERSGYLIDISKVNYNENIIRYNLENGKYFEISKNAGNTVLEERIGNNWYKYQKINGIKYYCDNGKWFTMLNGKRLDFSNIKKVPEITYDNNGNILNKVYNDLSSTIDNSTFNYYKDAYFFTKWIQSKGLTALTPSNAYDENASTNIGSKLSQSNLNQSIFGNNSSFAKNIQEPESRFNEHRLAIIRYTIEKNLSIAIKNYNHYAPKVNADFQMPKLNEAEWDKILDNITLISFLQGLPIGAKLYNGCSVVANNKNDEVVTENSIYLVVNSYVTQSRNYYYNPLYYKFTEYHDLTGVYNVDLERRAININDEVIYYNPKECLASYDSIVNANENVNIYSEKTDNQYNYALNGNIYKYMDKYAKTNVAKAYYTTLARERYCSYHIR